MIAEKIAQAKKDKQEKRFNLIAIICGAAIMAVFLLYLATNFKLSTYEENIVQGKTTEQDKSASAIPKAKPDEKTSQNTEVDRKAYINAYQHYQTMLKPSLDDIDIAQWNTALSNKLQLLENTALEQFSSGDYVSAFDAITKLNELADDTLRQSQNEFEEAIAKAEKAYLSLDTNMAILALDEASLHQENNPQLQALANQIGNIPTIRDIEETIRIANIENKPEEELQAINALFKVDSDWGDHTQRASNLRAQITTNQFNKAIANSYAALDKKQINTARSELNKAKAISPSRAEINQLNQSISQLERTQRFESNVVNAEKAAATDNWEKAKNEITQALINSPNDRKLTKQLDKANQIIALKQQITALLSNPYRLANESVKVRAKIALIQAESHSKDSITLRTLAAKLSTTVEAVNKEVNVSVTSDGKTNVTIRGIGIVGNQTSKVIQLKPGPYTFEGQRVGYKSKIVKVTIPINQTTFKLTVVADEPI